MSQDNQNRNQCPATRIQRQLWLIHAINPASSAYHVISCFDICGALDVPALEQSLKRVVARHEILRTTFFEQDGQLFQEIHENSPFALKVERFEETPPTDREATAKRRIDVESVRPFDLARGPLIRAHLFEMTETRHTLLIVMHHIITDVHAKAMFADEVSRHYAALAKAAGEPLPEEVAPQYAAYAHHQAAWLDSPEAIEMQQQWEKALEGQSGVLNLRTDHLRPAAQQFRGSAVPFEVGLQQTEKLAQYAASRDTDISTLLLTAYLALLYRYANQEDITVGVPFLDRSGPEHQATMGCFLNMLPISAALSSKTRLEDLLAEVHAKKALASDNRKIPFEEIVRTAASKHAPGTNPIFQVGFSVEPRMILELADLEIIPLPVAHHGAQLDLFLTIWTIDETIEGCFEYDVNLFDDALPEQLARHFSNLLEALPENGDKPIGNLEILTADEKQMLIHEWNDTAAELPQNTCLHHLFERWVQETPDAPAITCGDTTLTYAELDEKANQVAHYLKEYGVGENMFVGVNLERAIDMLVAILAVQKAGGAYVPLDPAFPRNRLTYIIEDTELKVLITQKQRFSELEEKGIRRILFDEEQEKIDRFSRDRLPLAANPKSLAYVLYTSGSTGKPKGIPIHHSAVVNFILSMAKKPGIEQQDALLAVTTLSFDISILELYLPLSVGARIILANQSEVTNGEALLTLIRSAGPTQMQATPSTWQLLVAAGLTEKLKLKILCGGEPLTAKLAQQLCSISDDVWNLYGPTETTVWSTCSRVVPNKPVIIGRPIDNTQIYIVDDQLNLTPPGVPGELLIGGAGVSGGYLNRPDLNQEKFIPDTFSGRKEGRIYRTGDLACHRRDGTLEHLGRIDYQIKLRGFRIELGEIENALSKFPGVKQCAVILYARSESDKRLVAYVTMAPGMTIAPQEAREFLRGGLPDYMLPAAFEQIAEMPLTANGKIARDKLPEPKLEAMPKTAARVTPKRETERRILSVWETLLGTKDIGVDDNFFDVGGTSLLAIQVASALKSTLDREIQVVTLFQYPTIEKLANHLDGDKQERSLLDDAYHRARRFRAGRYTGDPLKDGVAVIGMTGRFPGAHDLDRLWENLCNGVESITTFSRDELDPAIDEETRNDPDYVPCRGIVEDVDKFDAKFFDVGPLEARLMDPQQRIFLELAWAALENAGYTSAFDGMIGVYAGVGDNFYYPNNVLCHPELVKTIGKTIVGYGNEKDYIATRASYALNLTGPSVSASTGCSATLLAVDNAFKALLDYECDMALAGGVDICVPQKSGQMYQEGGTFTKDGHCRPFDAGASGTMFCDGGGVVVLRRLEDAIAAGDTIYAVIRGSAKNNDGSNKVSFLAPSVEGQAQVIVMAQAQADVSPESIELIEAHGTGTPLGDPIEIKGLTTAFRTRTDKNQYCYIGSIKGNIGHPTNAAGVAGLIKASLCLHHEQIPPSLHFERPNPKIDFENSPFKVVTSLTPWPRNALPRRAGVSCFGFGGTNVHSILEEAPVLEPSGPSRPVQLLLLSAKTDPARARLHDSFATYFDEKPDTNLADAAFTLQVGRHHHRFRSYVVCKSPDEARAMLEKGAGPGTGKRETAGGSSEIVFMFPGQGAQYVNMGLSLYRHEPLFKREVDTCCDILSNHLDRDLRELLFPSEGDEKTAYDSLKNTYYTQPAIFTIEYALARLWMSWGITPSAMIGHSIGEFVCATLAGVFTLEDVLGLVALRGSLMRDLPRGSMLSVRCAAKEIEGRLPDSIQLAASNGPALSVVAGPTDDVNAFSEAIAKEGLVSNHLHTSHAFHSKMMSPIVEPYVAAVSQVRREKPQLPFLSTCTGDWITDEIATSPEYWGRHLRMPVRFSEAVSKLLLDSDNLFLEVGPRNVLTTLARQHAAPKQRRRIVPSLGSSPDNDEEWVALVSAVGELWLNGTTIDWERFYEGERRQRIPLPTYPFERTRYWIDPAIPAMRPAAKTPLLQTMAAIDAASQDADHPIVSPSEEKGPKETVARALKEMLVTISGLEPSEIETGISFLELGFDSLLLTQFSAQIQSAFGKKISFRQISRDYATIDLLTDHLVSELGIGEAPSSLAGEEISEAASTGTPTRIPITEPQREIWLSCKVSDAASCAYNDSFSLRFKGPFDLDAFKTAVDSVVARHDALRSAFSEDGSTLVISNENTTEFSVVDVEGDPNPEQRHDEIVEANARRPFDLERGGLLRVIVVRNSPVDVTCILSAHHIICDGWSIDVIIKDLATLYTSIKEERDAGLQPTRQFSEYAKAPETGEEAEAALAFWKEKFQTEPPVLDLPTDFPRPSKRSYDASRHLLPISQEIFDELKKRSAKENCSVFSLLLSGLYILMHKLSKQEDIVIGIPVAGQPMIGEPGLVGHCVSFLPIRQQVDKSTPAATFFKDLQAELTDAYDHYQCTYGALLKHISISRQPGRVPLISVLLTNSAAYRREELVFADLELSYAMNARCFETFDLYFNSREENGRLSIACQFNTNLYTAETIERYLKSYEQILAQIAFSGSISIRDIDPLTPMDWALLSRLNDTAAEYDRGKTAHELFSKKAAETPSRIALRFNKTTVSYGELDARSSALARVLAQMGVSKKPVGLFIDRSPEMIVGLYAILKAGGAYLPIDPALPEERIAFMLEDTGAGVVVTGSALKAALPKSDTAVVCIDDIVTEDSSTAPLPRVSPEDLAYIIYTSGSTGKPKGVQVPHRALVNLISSIAKQPGVTDKEVVLAVTTLSFDVAAAEIHVPLVCGGTVVIASRTEVVDGRLLLSAIRENRATLMQATPATWRLLISAGWDASVPLRVISTGEALPMDLAEQLLERSDEVWDLYGPTETTVWSTGVRLEKPLKEITIGKPIDNTQIYIVDEEMKPLLPGVVGEMYIGGDGVTAGYLGRPALTDERFVENPFDDEGGKIYRTGDLVRLTADGNIFYLGRSDFQVKLRGYRIELGEIEVALTRLAGVKQATVVVREISQGDLRLAAFWVAEGENPPEEAVLKSALRKRLPDYMVPQHFMRLDALPLTTSQKVDRNALPALDISSETRTGGVPPRTAVEKGLAAIWCDTLHLSSVGVHDDFFQLGGHSLLAAQMIAELQSQHDVTLPFSAVFETPTIEGLALQVERAAQGTKIPKLEPGEDPPLSLMQQRLWFLNEIDAGGVGYNLPSAVRFRGPLHTAHLESAFNDIIGRHGTLRTTIEKRQGPAVQVVRDSLEYSLEIVDISRVPEADREAQLMALLTETTAKSFRFDEAPLFVAFIVKLSKQEHVFFFMPHHTIWDGWSFDLFYKELSEHYRARLEQRPPNVPDLPISYGDFSKWHREWITGDEIKRQSDFWSRRLEGELDPLALPADRNRPAVFRYDHGKYVTLSISKEKVDALAAVAAAHNATLFMVLVATYKLLLSRLTGQTDILVGTPVRGRSVSEVENLIGFFSNMIVLRTKIDGQDGFSKLLDKVKETCIDSFANQDMPFEQIVQNLSVSRDMSHTPIYQTIFSFQDMRETRVDYPDLDSSPVHIGPSGVQTDFGVWLMLDNTEMLVSVGYATDLFDDVTVVRWMRAYEMVLDSIVAETASAIATLPIIHDIDEAQLAALNDTTADYPREKTAHELFEARAAAVPDKAALIFEDDIVTYADLDARATLLARRLLALDVHGKPVGLFVDRSPDMVIGLYGILKAGGAYIPIDPALPPDRVSFMLDDAKTDIIVTQSHLKHALPDINARIVAIDDAGDAPDSSAALPKVSPDEIAYIIYTSGSTGKPKGVQVPHRCLVNLISSIIKVPGVTKDDVVLAVTTLSFDVAAAELHVPLVCGGSVVIASKTDVTDGKLLLKRIRENRVTLMQATPVTWRILIASGWDASLPLRVISTGEALPKDLAEQLVTRSDEVWNLYGPTETTVWSTGVRLQKPIDEITIGKPIDNTQIYILSKEMTPVLPGVIGEMYIGGDGVTAGYLGRKALNAERFVDNPFDERGAKLYRTGDLVRLNNRGDIVYLGRSDFQVKLRGYRIELGEIENVIAKHPAIRQCAVIVHERTARDQRLVAYIALEKDEAVTSADIREFLRAELPDYMVPSLFQQVDALPLTESGKIARNRLPAPVYESPKRGQVDDAPHLDTERKLLDLWSELLGNADIGIHDNFFDVGGNSLLAVEATAAIETRFDVQMSVAQFFRYPSISSLAAHLDKRDKTDIADQMKQRAKRRQSARARQRKIQRS